MTETHARNSSTTTRARPRMIVHRTRGTRHGTITRLMSPGDLGQVLKPFVFLDLFDMGEASFPGIGLHPHSGIATMTYLFEGSVRYEDTTGATGVLREGGVEWFKAGHGAWHGGGPGDADRSRGFQLWLALPPDEELGPVENIYQAPDTVARDGPARVLLGMVEAAFLSLRGWMAANSRSSSRRMARSPSLRTPMRSSLLGRRLRTLTTSCSAATRCIPARRPYRPAKSGSARSNNGCRTKADSESRRRLAHGLDRDEEGCA